MKRFSKTKLVLGTAMLLALGASGTTVNAATDDVTIDAVIITPLTITAVNNLDFGELSVGATGGDAVVSSAGVLSVTGDVAGVGGTPNQGTFDLAGDGTRAFQVSAPASVTISSGGNNMTVDDFTLDAGAAGVALTGNLVAGAFTGNLGGTLTVGASQAPGTYTGTVTLTAIYN